MSPPTAGFPFSQFRRLRFGDRRPCPYCATTRIQKWGTFSGRQRYRCLSCRRTYSDFTATPLANLKLVHQWPAFCRCILEGRSVRRTASALRVDKTTAFRWRHRLLAALDASDTAPLGTVVTVHETWFPYAEKGRRDLKREPRRRAAFHHYDARRVWVFVALDNAGRPSTGVLGSRRPLARDLVVALAARLVSTSEIASISGPYGAAGLLAVRLNRRYRRVRPRSPGFRALRAYVARLRGWLKPFRGVATRYLSNYLAWHRFMELAADPVTGGGSRLQPSAMERLLAAQFP